MAFIRLCIYTTDKTTKVDKEIKAIVLYIKRRYLHYINRTQPINFTTMKTLKINNKLQLKKEAIVKLTTPEMRSIMGGGPGFTRVGICG